MAKRQDLKRRLKASDKRRRRRSESVASAPSEVATATAKSVDVAGLITAEILAFAERTDARDAVVVSALRSCLKATLPGGDQSRDLAQRLEAICGQPEVQIRAFRTALSQLVELAAQHRDPKDTASFVRYLTLLSG